MPFAAISLLLAFTPIAFDKATRSVTFTARATEVTAGTTVEFLFVGPESDRAYEAMFVTDANVSEIAQAFEAAGIPRGQPVSPTTCRFWPAGKQVSIEPSPWAYITDENNEGHLPILFTGGLRDAVGTPVAQTNMPNAVFALYGLDQSLMLFDDAIDQSAVYGRFKCNGKAKPGERVAFTVKWDGKTGSEHRRLLLKPNGIRESIASLKGAKSDIDVTPAFAPELTVKEAVAAAGALSVVDSRAIKINGFEDGQMFYRAFLPDEKWRDRQKRITQPLEVSISDTNTVFTVIDEDWTVEGDDPKLTPHEETIDFVAKSFKGDTCLFFALPSTRLSRIYDIMRHLPKSIRNWYVYVD